jgi:hypothetical protein
VEWDWELKRFCAAMNLAEVICVEAERALLLKPGKLLPQGKMDAQIFGLLIKQKRAQ